MYNWASGVFILLVCFFSIFECAFADLAQDIVDRAKQGGTDYSNGISSSSLYGASGVNRNMLQVGGGDNSANSSTSVTFKDNFLRNIQVYIIGLLWIVSVSVFLYIAYILFTAEGKEEEFKKAWKALTYAVVWLAVIPLAFIVVKIVTGFTF